MKYDAHDHAVMLRINRHIEVANKTYPQDTVGKRLNEAWGMNIAEREKDAASSSSTIGRDADHYFAGRLEVSRKAAAVGGSKLAKGVVSAGGLAVKGFYETLKAASALQEAATDGPGFMRTNKDLPNAPLGGWTWFVRGEADAFGDEIEGINLVKPHQID